jgi:hypothetical protein
MSEQQPQQQQSFIVATRIHLGKQSNPPPQTKLISTLSTFIKTATDIGACKAVVAIDPTEKIKGYDLVQAMEDALQEVRQRHGNNVNVNGDESKSENENGNENGNNNGNINYVDCDLLQVSPWGNFVPALNALTSYACGDRSNENSNVNTILFISAETTLTKQSMMSLCQHMNIDDTLVVGAALPGHDYMDDDDDDTAAAAAEDANNKDSKTNNKEREVDLNGRTCPWNTLALWNLEKMLIGFPLLADGVHKMDDGSSIAAGIEEFSTILIHQKVLGIEKTKAKLVKVQGIEWEQSFDDEERKKWHEAKMKSKLSRAEMHRDALGGNKIRGIAIHI